jgi:hypothetical protein
MIKTIEVPYDRSEQIKEYLWKLHFLDRLVSTLKPDMEVFSVIPGSIQPTSPPGSRSLAMKR